MTESTRVSLLIRVRDLADGPSWGEFDAIYRPLIFGYLRRLGLGAFDADELTQEVFSRLMKKLPTYELDRQKARFRTFLWKVTYHTLVDRARRQKVRDEAERQWMRKFRETEESIRRKHEEEWRLMHRRRLLQVVLPWVQSQTSPRLWTCFEGLMLLDRPAKEIAAELGLSKNSVYVYSHRVLQRIRDRCARIEGEHDDGDDLEPS